MKKIQKDFLAREAAVSDAYFGGSPKAVLKDKAYKEGHAAGKALRDKHRMDASARQMNAKADLMEETRLAHQHSEQDALKKAALVEENAMKRAVSHLKRY